MGTKGELFDEGSFATASRACHEESTVLAALVSECSLKAPEDMFTTEEKLGFSAEHWTEGVGNHEQQTIFY